MQLRSYQEAAIAAIRKHHEAGVNRQLLSMCTGAGKTSVFSSLPEKLKDRLPGQTMVLLHREELAEQAIARMRLINPTLRVDKEMAGRHADPSLADVVVASVATLGRQGNKRLTKYNWQNFDKYVVDEAHRSTAQSYTNVYEAAGLLQDGDKRLLLGVTATPQRADGKALATLYQKIVYSYGLREAIEDGWLVDVKGVRVSTSTSLDGVKTVGGEFDQEGLAATVNTPARNQQIVKAWLEHASGRTTAAFTVDIKHAQDLAAMFQHYGVKAAAIWGSDPLRAEKLQQLRDGEITVICNAQLLVEGVDIWQISCVVHGRPTKSGVFYSQASGRSTRLEEGLGNLKDAIAGYNHLTPGYPPKSYPFKTDAIILDVVDASTRHSLTTLPTLMGLSSALDLKGRSLVRAIQDIEQAQKEYQNVDFSKLEDITKLKTFIESVNLFEVKFLPEVENNSQLCWHPAADGGYVMLLPNNDEVRITQNLLDKFDLFANIKGKRYKGERDTLEAAFARADELVQDTCSEALKILKRESPWHKDPPTESQLKLIAKLYKGRAIPNDISKGMASRLIGQALAGKK